MSSSRSALLPEHASSRGGSLAPWIFGPLLALGLVGLAVANLPNADCYGQGADDSLPRALVTLATVASVAILLAAAVWRLRALNRAGKLPWELGTAVLLLLVAPAIVAVMGVGLAGGVIGVFPLAIGIGGTGIIGLVLFGGLIGGDRVDDAGLLVPAYLSGVACFCCSSLGIVALILEGGALC